MFQAGLETKKEVAVICLFHLLGVSMEIFKVYHGAWAYSEVAYSKIMGVPLYSGFMYTSVASYICQAWRNFDLKFEYWPSLLFSSIFALAIYGNFFTNTFLSDGRLILSPLLVIVFWKTQVYFKTNGIVRRTPVLLGFFLIAFFI
jgi:uncharacterized membrane protein YoaT (DUF817 family)